MKKLIIPILFILIVATSTGFLYARKIKVIEEYTISNFLINTNPSVDSEETKLNLFLHSNGEYYLFLPKNVNRDKVRVQFTANTGTLNAYDINNNKIGTIKNNFDTNVFEKDKVIVKSSPNSDNNMVINVMHSNLPSISINLKNGEEDFIKLNSDELHETKVKGNSLITDENNETTKMKVKVKGRGNTSWKREKKPYQINFKNKTSLLGMKESKKWILLSNHADGSLSRNYLWYSLAKELNLEYSVEFKPVDLYINNEYQGMYLATSKVEKHSNRLNLSEEDALLEIDHHTDDFNITTSKGYNVLIHEPKMDKIKDENELLQKQKEIKSYLDNIENIIYKNEYSFELLSNYLDVESFAKFYWVQELSENFDASRGSFFTYIKNGKLYAGPVWDMDATLNRSYFYAPINEYYILDDTMLNNRVKANWFRELMKNQEFSNLVDEVFLDNIDVFNNLPNILNDYNKKIKNSAAMNYIKWEYENMKNAQPEEWLIDDYDYTSSLNLLNNNLLNRLNWYKEQYDTVLYTSIEYSYINMYNESISGEVQPINYLSNINQGTTINLYGIKEDKTKILLKTITYDGNDINETIELTKKTTSPYKIYNKLTYSINFVNMI